MHKKSIIAALSLLLAPGVVMADCAIDFDAQIQRSLDRRCAACHNEASPGGNLILSRGASYDNLVGVAATGLPSMPLVTGGDREASYLYHKLAGTHTSVGGTGDRMPMGGELPEADLALIGEWIDTCVPAAAGQG